MKKHPITEKERTMLMPASVGTIYQVVQTETGLETRVQHVLENPYFRKEKGVMKFAFDGRWPRKVDRFIERFISIEVDMKLESLLVEGIWLEVAATKKPRIFVKSPQGYLDLSRSGSEPYGELPEGCAHYNFFSPVPSGLRKETLTMVRLESEEDKQSAISDLNANTTGAYALLEGEECSVGVGGSNAQRLGAPLAPQKCWMDGITSYAIHQGKWADNAIDGMGFILADERTAAAISVLVGRKLQPRDLYGLMIQARPTGVAKCSLTFVSPRFMQRMLELHGADVYGDGLPLILLDRNALKLAFQYGDPINLEVLDVVRRSDAHTSVQIWQKMLSEIDRSEIVVFDRMLFRDAVDEKMNPILTNQPHCLGFDAYKGNLAVAEIGLSKSPAMAMRDAAYFQAGIVKGVVQGLVNDASRLYHKIAGGFGRLQADVSVVVTKAQKKLLRYGEVYLGGQIGRLLAGQTIMLYKYPTVGRGEFYRARVVGFEELLSRIGSEIDDVQERRILVEYYENLYSGVIVLPAIPEIKKLLAGCDFDWDGAIFISDPEYIRLTAPLKPMLVNIEADGEKDKKIVGRFGLALFPRLCLSMLRRGRSGSTVGVVTRNNDVIVSLATASLEVQKQVLTAVFKNVPVKKYIGLAYSNVQIDGEKIESVTVRPIDAQKVYWEVRNAFLDEAACHKILKDLNVIYRMLQETTIDSVKTGIVVKPMQNFISIAASAIHCPKTVAYDRDKKEFEVKGGK